MKEMRVAITVELDAYVLPSDHTVYKFFPGEGYKFYEVISQTSIAFIDVRGLDELQGPPSNWDDDEVLDTTIGSHDDPDTEPANAAVADHCPGGGVVHKNPVRGTRRTADH